MTPTRLPAGPRRSPLRPVDIPAEVLRVLKSIAADMRAVPREIVHDPAELFLWLRRMAARLDGVERIHAEPRPQPSKPAPEPQNLTVGGVFGRPGYSGSEAGPKSAPRAGKSGRRTITGPQGQRIPVETRSLTLWP